MDDRYTIDNCTGTTAHLTISFSSYEQLEEIVSLAAQSLPSRPDGIVTVAKFTSATSDNCRSTEAEFERVARANPATLFLRCFKEYENADILFGQAQVTVIPTFDMFYRGTFVADSYCARAFRSPSVLRLIGFSSRQPSSSGGRVKFSGSRRAFEAIPISKFETRPVLGDIYTALGRWKGQRCKPNATDNGAFCSRL